MRTHLKTVAFLACGLVFLAFAPAALAAVPKQIVQQVGSPKAGEAGGLFKEPRGVAVNQTGAGGVEPGTFYVVDAGNRRIQRFSPSGTFVSAWGWKVVQGGTSKFEICTVATECQIGFPGTGAGQLDEPRGIGVDQANGNIYVSDPSSSSRRIHIFSAQGAFEGDFGTGLVTGGPGLQFCTATCVPAYLGGSAEEGPGGKFGHAEIGDAGIGGIAVDSAGNVYVANEAYRRIDVFKPILTGNVVTGVEFLRAFGWGVLNGASELQVCELDPNAGFGSPQCQVGLSGSGLGQFGGTNSSPSDVAIDSEGNIFAVDRANKRIEEFSSSLTPITANFGSAALTAAFGTGEPLNIAIDPSLTPNHILVSGKRSVSPFAGKVAVVELDHSGANSVEGGGVHGQEITTTASAGLAIAKASIGGTLYLTSEVPNLFMGFYALNALPTIKAPTEVTGTTATFNGEAISDGFDVTYHFEYSSNGGKTWTKVPTTDADAGTQPGKIEVHQEATGLTGSTEYKVRLVQNRATGGGEATSEATTFTTEPAAPTIAGTVAWPIRDTSATLNAYLNPENQTSSYHFEYGTSDCSADPDPCTALPAQSASGGGIRLIGQVLGSLQPNTVYHYRLLASNETGPAESPDRAFETFTSGRSLPDNRGYELVTPPDTGGIILDGGGIGESEGIDCFNTYPATADGESLITMSSKGGPLSLNGTVDLYESLRGPEGIWSTVSKSATASQSAHSQGGLCASPDHTYSTLLTGRPPGDQGSLVLNGESTSYIRKPDGEFELVGLGSEGQDPKADVRWISDGASHVIFTSKAHLESGGPTAGTEAVYDRIPGGSTSVVSLLPGEATPAAGEDAEYQGSSPDGSVVAFKVGGKMFVRADGSEAQEVAPDPNTFAGISADGKSLFYTDATPPVFQGSNPPAGLFAYDIGEEEATEIAPNSNFVNVSEDGSRVYFISTEAIAGSGENELEQHAEAGKHNLYVWDRESGESSFITAAFDEPDIGPLKSWTSAVVVPKPSAGQGPAEDPSRTTLDGKVLAFETHANPTAYDSAGHTEIYRYDSESGNLDCVSCPPEGVPATEDAKLAARFGLRPTSALLQVQNLSADGSKVFFQTKDPLVPADVNGTWDVYEWKAGQQAYPISSGKGARPSFLYAMSPDGSNVFFTSSERLSPRDPSTVQSIYDARVGGGEPPLAQQRGECLGEACQPNATAPNDPTPASSSFQGAGNVKPEPSARCPKGKRKVRKAGKARCVKPHKKKGTNKAHHAKRHHRANNNRRAAR